MWYKGYYVIDQGDNCLVESEDGEKTFNFPNVLEAEKWIDENTALLWRNVRVEY